MQLVWSFDQSTESKAFRSFDYTTTPNIVVNQGSVQLFVGDPAIVQDMLVTKNAQIDKTGQFEGIFKNFFGSSFLFSKTDEIWKLKRKGLAHAFYKDKLMV